MKTKALTIFILAATLLGCSKDKSSIALNGALTNCPANSACSYIYYDNANFTNTLSVQSGQNRVFTYASVNSQVCGETTSLYFKTTLSNNDFEIDAAQIASGQAITSGESCPCCESVGSIQYLGGDIKGKKTGSNTWLINATVIRQYGGTTIRDTLVVNQYFTLSTMNAVAL